MGGMREMKEKEEKEGKEKRKKKTLIDFARKTIRRMTTRAR